MHADACEVQHICTVFPLLIAYAFVFLSRDVYPQSLLNSLAFIHHSIQSHCFQSIGNAHANPHGKAA